MPRDSGRIVRLIPLFLLALSTCHFDPIRSPGPNLCRIATWCFEPAPSPVELRVARAPARLSGEVRGMLKAHFPGEMLVSLLEGGIERDEARTRTRRKVLGGALYFVVDARTPRAGALVAIPRRFEGDPIAAQVLMRHIDPAASRFWIDGPGYREGPSVSRVAVVDRHNGVGPTFAFDHDLKHYVRHEPDSAYVLRAWMHSVTSSCGGGPLTAVPQSWWDARNRDCLANRARWRNRRGD